MTPSRKPLAFFLTILLTLSTVALSSSTNAEETSARATNNEEIVVFVNDIYYDRGGDITFTVTSTNLDPATEYTIDWNLCYYTWSGCSGSGSFTSASGTYGSIDIGSGNMFTSSTITFTDPGYFTEDYDPVTSSWTLSGTNNNSYIFHAELHVQGVELDTNTSDPFIYGGEIAQDSSYISTVDNILKSMNVSFEGHFSMDHANYYLIDYTTTCNLYESGATSPVDSIVRNSNSSNNWNTLEDSAWNTNTNSYEKLTPTASSGPHYVECDLTRNVDNAHLGTVTSNVFQVIDADITGNEEVAFDSMSSRYYPRSDASATSTISFDVMAENLYSGTEYTIDWNLCYYTWSGCSGSGGFTSTDGTYGSATFTAISNGPHTETITFTDPGYFTEDYDPVTSSWTLSGTNNNSYIFHAELHVQGVELDTNTSDPFIYGGEIAQDSSYISTVDNILKSMNVSFEGHFSMDHANYYLIDYTTTCNLYESGATSPVDSIVRNSNSSNNWNTLEDSAWNTNTNSYEKLTPTASSGPHYVECDLTRNVDNAHLGTVTSNVFQVIDDTSNQDDATIVVGTTLNLQEAWGTVTIDAVDLDSGQEYTLDWVVEDHSLSPPTIMMQNDHIWVAGSDGTYTYELEFHDLADTSNACITVTFTAGDDELQVVNNVCWPSASTADGDGDGVYDKNDLCPDTTAGLTVTADGCSDSDNDGFDTDLEIDCNTDPNDAFSFPTDLDNDGTCDYLDTDTDGDGYLDVDELAAGTDPFNPLSKPANRLPECAVYYNLEIDGIPTAFDGEAAIPALSGVTATTGAASLTPTTVTIPAGSYYITAHCIDPDGDDVTVTVNEITVGPVAGEVSGAVLIEIGEDVDETMDVQITWSDGTDSLTALVTVELDGGSQSLIPGFGTALTIMALLGAGFVLTRKDD